MNKIQKTDLDIHLGEEKLEIKKFLKYVDSKLKWEKRKQSTSFKLQKIIGIIRGICFLQEKQLTLLFSGFISLYLDYGSLVWEGAAKAHVNKFAKVCEKRCGLLCLKTKNILPKPFMSLELNNNFSTCRIHEKTYLSGTP